MAARRNPQDHTNSSLDCVYRTVKQGEQQGPMARWPAGPCFTSLALLRDSTAIMRDCFVFAYVFRAVEALQTPWTAKLSTRTSETGSEILFSLLRPPRPPQNAKLLSRDCSAHGPAAWWPPLRRCAPRAPAAACCPGPKDAHCERDPRSGRQRSVLWACRALHIVL